MATSSLLRIGTRGSPLALAQAHETAGRLAAAPHPDQVGYGLKGGNGAAPLACLVLSRSGLDLQFQMTVKFMRSEALEPSPYSEAA